MSEGKNSDEMGFLEPQKPRNPFLRRLSVLILDCARVLVVFAFAILMVLTSFGTISARHPEMFQWLTDNLQKVSLEARDAVFGGGPASASTRTGEDPPPKSVTQAIYSAPSSPPPFYKTFEGYVFYEVTNDGDLTRSGQLGKDGRKSKLPAFMELKPGELLRAQSWINVRSGPDKDLRIVNVMRIFECARVLDVPLAENITSDRTYRTGGWIRVAHADCMPLYEMH